MSEQERQNALDEAVYTALCGASTPWAEALRTMGFEQEVRLDVAMARTAARAALRFLGFDGVPAEGAVQKAREALREIVARGGGFDENGTVLMTSDGLAAQIGLAALEVENG